MTYPKFKPYTSLYPPMHPIPPNHIEDDEEVPLWTAIPTSITLEGRVVYGRAFEIPELQRVIHTVELTGLLPDREYEFHLPEGDITTVYTTLKGDARTNVVIHWQTTTPLIKKSRVTYQKESYKFKTFPQNLNDRSITMISGGDIYQPGQEEKLRTVFDVINNRKPDLFVIAGDIAYANNQWVRRGQWHRFWNEWYQRIDRSEPLIPLVVGIGNHEVGNGSTITEWHGSRFNFDEKFLGENTWFAAQFAFPRNGAYDVLDFGNYLSIVMLDSEHASPQITGTDEQTIWLQSVLDARKNIKHVIPFTHVPAYPASRSFNNVYSKRVREFWTPIYETHPGVKVVFEHHDHVYKRTKPIKHVDGEPQEHPDGIRYLGDGALGVVIRDGWNPNTTWYLEESIASTYVQAESGATDPLDGQPGNVDEAWHMYETIFENDKRTINTINILGDGNGTVYHTIVQEVDHV